MKLLQNSLLLLLVTLMVSCGGKQKQHEQNDTSSDKQQATSQPNNSYHESSGVYDDGTYEATVNYYNPNSGSHSTYTLTVEVEDNIVTVIYFNNGGQLDETHIISGGELDSDGATTIYSDKGYQYDILLHN